MRASWRLLWRSPVPWGLLALLIAFTWGGGTGSRSVTQYASELNSQIAWLGIWGALNGALLAARDRGAGMPDLLGSLPVERSRYVAGQAAALTPLLGLALLVAAVTVWWPHRPDLWSFVPARVPSSLLPSLAGTLALTWLGLALGHLLRGPLVYIAPVVLTTLIASASLALPHTLGFLQQNYCSELLGCPPLPYGLQALWFLALAVLAWLFAARASRWLALDDSGKQKTMQTALGLTAVAAIGFTAPQLLSAARTYPQWDYRATPAWPPLNPERPDLAVALVPDGAYACTSGEPRVCLPRTSAQLGERLQQALQRLKTLQPDVTLPNVTTYADLDFAARNSHLMGRTLYLSERRVREAVPSRVTQSITTGGKAISQVVQLPDDLYFLQREVLHVLRATPYSGPQPQRTADGITIRGENPDARGLVEEYTAWLALREDPRGGLVEDTVAHPEQAVMFLSPELLALWRQGTRVTHERLLSELRKAVASGQLRGPAAKAVLFARQVK